MSGSDKQKRLLQSLASAIEHLIIGQANNPSSTVIWGVYGGLARVLDLIQRALTDGSLFFDRTGREECRTFILDDYDGQLNLFGSSSIEGWLQLQMSSQSLTDKLRDLYADRERTNMHYKPESISSNPVLRQTLLMSLEALEHMDLTRLATLNLTSDKKNKNKRLSKTKSEIRYSQKGVSCKPRLWKSCPNLLPSGAVHKRPKRRRSFDAKLALVTNHRRSSLSRDTKPRLRSKASAVLFSSDSEDENNRKSPSKKSPSFKRSHTKIVTKMSLGSQEQVSCSNVSASPQDQVDGWNDFTKSHQRTRSDSSLTSIVNMEGHKSENTGSWAEIVPASTGWYPKPRANQSLVSFLAESGGESSRVGRRAQLDRENAHFILSEAMISTMEQLKFEASMTNYDEEGDSDEEIKQLKERIKIRRREVKNSKVSDSPNFLSDGRTDTGTTDQSGSPAYSSPPSGQDDEDLVSDDEDFARFERDKIPDGSAEWIALSLLSRVGSGRLPPADQLTWLVSADQVPQDLLPLPNSLPVDPEADMKDATELRGTLSWAPPRPQIVLTVRNKPKSKSAALSQQKWMCAGCGMRVERQYSKSFRFCHYLGRYFCTGCHSNSTALIPARVIYNWDFKKYAVSNFSMDILSKMFQEPLFNIRDLSPDLLKKIEKLKNVASARNQLTKLKRYISSCRIAGDVKVLVLNTSVPDPDMYSIQDLSQTRAGQLGPAIRSVVSKGLNHVKSCDLCQARAHICEGCHASNTIFPFQVGVWECSECGACYHRSCYRPTTGCGRCVRKHLRQQAQPEMC